MDPISQHAGKVLLPVLAALLVLVIGLGWLLSRGSDSASTPLTPPEPARTPADTAGAVGLEAVTRTAEPKERTDLGTESPAAPAPAPARTGTIVVHVVGPDGQPFDGAWTLAIEEHAAGPVGRARRTFEHSGPSASVEARTDRRHILSARSLDLASLSVRCDLPVERPSAEVELVLGAAGVVGGLVVDAEGRGVGELAVWLLPRLLAPPSHRGTQPAMSIAAMPIQAATDAGGAYRLEGVQPGTWSLVVGDPDSPLVSRDKLEITAGQTWLDPLALPVLHVATVRVKDEQGRIVPGAKVSSRGTGGGAIEGVTDSRGELACKQMPAGRWRVHVTTADGRRGNVAVEIPLADEATAIEIVVRAPVPDVPGGRR